MLKLKTMDKKTRKDFIDLFAEGFEAVVAPEIEELRKEVKQGFSGVNKRLETVKNRLEAVEVRLDRVAANQLEDRTQLKDNEQRIKKLESRRALA